MFILNAKFSTFLLSLNLSFSHLIFLQCLSKFVVLLYYCLMLLEKCSTCISFLLITLFIPHLNSFINALLSYLLFFTALLNFCTNSSIVLLLYSTFFNSATFIILHQILSLDSLEELILLLLQIPNFYSLCSSLHFSSRCLPILFTCMISPTEFFSLPKHFSFSFWYITYIPLKSPKSCLYPH